MHLLAAPRNRYRPSAFAFVLALAFLFVNVPLYAWTERYAAAFAFLVGCLVFVRIFLRLEQR